MEYATEEYYKSRITELEATINEQTDYAREVEVAQLKESLESVQARAQRYIESYNTVLTDQTNTANAMREWTVNELSNEDITETQAESIAEIMGFELTQDFEATVVVEYYITVNARDKESAREVVEDIDFESVSYDSDGITYLSATVERIDF